MGESVKIERFFGRKKEMDIISVTHIKSVCQDDIRALSGDIFPTTEQNNEKAELHERVWCWGQMPGANGRKRGQAMTKLEKKNNLFKRFFLLTTNFYTFPLPFQSCGFVGFQKIFQICSKLQKPAVLLVKITHDDPAGRERRFPIKCFVKVAVPNESVKMVLSAERSFFKLSFDTVFTPGEGFRCILHPQSTLNAIYLNFNLILKFDPAIHWVNRLN